MKPDINREFVAIVGLIKQGREEKFAVTHPADIGEPVTFTITASVWSGPPVSRGTLVVLSNIVTRAEGFRAMKARPYVPDDNHNMDLAMQKEIIHKRHQEHKAIAGPY